MGDGVDVLFVLRYQNLGASIQCLPFPDYSPEYPLAESSYAHDVFFDLCLIAEQLARILNRGAESQGNFACGRAICRIHARAWRYVKEFMPVEVPIHFVNVTRRYRRIHAGMLVSYSNKKKCELLRCETTADLKKLMLLFGPSAVMGNRTKTPKAGGFFSPFCGTSMNIVVGSIDEGERQEFHRRTS